MVKKFSKYKYQKYEKECVDLVIQNNIVFTDEIFIYSEVLPSVFFEMKLNESQKIKDAIDINRAKLKRDLRLKWFDSSNGTMNVALYKLICSDDEKRSLSSSSVSKTNSNNDFCTQEEYLKSLKEMGEILENAD